MRFMVLVVRLMHVDVLGLSECVLFHHSFRILDHPEIE